MILLRADLALGHGLERRGVAEELDQTLARRRRLIEMMTAIFGRAG